MSLAKLALRFSLNLLLQKLFKTRIVLLSRKGRLSQFNAYVESELREHHYNVSQGLERDISLVFINPNEIPNVELKNLYSKHATFICFGLHKARGLKKLSLSVLLQFLEAIASPGGFVSLGSSRSDPKNWYLWTRCEPVIKSYEPLSLVKSKEYRLLSTHIALNAKFCLLAYRQSEYYERHVDLLRNKQASPDFGYRNPNFSDFIPLIEWLISEKIQVIRMGLPSQSVAYKREGFYDFSGSGYCPKLDVYLASRCHFLISGACGYHCMASIFNKPVLLTHAYGLKLGGFQGLVLPSKYRRSAVDLDFNQVLALNMEAQLPSGVQLFHPSDQEILEAGKEFLRKTVGIKGKYSYEKNTGCVGRFALAEGISFADTWLENNIHMFKSNCDPSH